MTKNYQELHAELSARPDHDDRAKAAQARLEAEDQVYFRRLTELRRARDMTQVALAKRLNMAQPTVSRLERQADLYLSTLRRYVEAAGGRLEVRAVFDDMDAEIRFDDLEVIDHDNPELGEANLREAL